MQLSAAIPVPPDWQRSAPIEQEYSLAVPLGYQPGAFAAPPRIAVMLHAFHVDLVPEIFAYLRQMPLPADLFVSTDSAAKQAALAPLLADWPQGRVEIRLTPNRGRDVAPKLIGLATAHAGYDLVLHLHTKRSTHESGMAGWRGYLLETLVGSAAVMYGIVEIFRQVPALGMLAPQHIDMLRPWIRWGANYDHAATLARRMGFDLSPTAPLDFPAGSMFWARPAALAPLLELGLDFADFDEERGQTDGTLAHAIERLYFLACEEAGFTWMKIAAPGLLHDERGVIPVNSAFALRRIVTRTAVSLRKLAQDEDRSHGLTTHLRAFPPAPLRPARITWRAVLGLEAPPRGTLAVLPLGWAPGPETGAGATAAHLPQGARLLMLDEAEEADCDIRLRAAFAAGADLVLLLGRPVALHPGAAGALLQMSAAGQARALLVPLAVPDFAPAPAAALDFTLPALPAGAAFAMPRTLYEAVGAMAGASLQAYAERAQAAGFAIRLCPRALFMPLSLPRQAGAA